MSIGHSIDVLCSRDSFNLLRPLGGTDEEGFPVQSVEFIGQFRGAWGTPRTQDIEAAARMDESVQAVCAGTFEARVGDKLTNLRGRDWVVTHVRPSPLVGHYRYFLREED